ncbi:uncharacterized protein LOC18422810 isoform X2 [Amborella trichopoda]|uniref:uncharacterized protein LOC18422810 isoform X2 n=1 Tax=Amborella trichopoda TaxID=13333 RepID=UPI0009BF3047|nr:uncharacterized protein LOC18422810 isoform X2 [Amborella trichopoda]|eukprot:XP_020524600.1 uncharacterized protein LOC18422810 isoform X2 [Amborella trichopoda]
MANHRPLKRLFQLDSSLSLIKGRLETYQQYLCSVIAQRYLQSSKPEKMGADDNERKDENHVVMRPKTSDNKKNQEKPPVKLASDDEINERKWRLELAWLTRALEPALQLYRWALPAGDNDVQQNAGSRSFAEIIASLHRSKKGIQDWSLGDLAVGLYLIYLRQASTNKIEDVKCVQISSDYMVQDLIYHTELAKVAYKGNAAGLARNSMLREKNVLKFVKDSSVMRPGYYIGTDTRNKLVVLGIRGTHTVYDLITDMVSSSHQEATFEEFSTHFGTAEAARWFLCNELDTLRNCLEKHPGFGLRLVGHSLGGATASLLAIMLRNKSKKELGFSSDIVSAVGIGTPPCVSKELAESCRSYVSTVVLQDDIIPRLSPAALAKLRNEILQIDWMTILEKEDWRSVVDLVTNAKQVVSSVQDVARKCAEYATFSKKRSSSDILAMDIEPADSLNTPREPLPSPHLTLKSQGAAHAELFAPGTLYHVRRKVDVGSGNGKGKESYTLWKALPGEHFDRIILSSSLISDHRCDNHYYALRDVLKGIPSSHHAGAY